MVELTSKLPWFIPHLRHIHETEEDLAYLKEADEVSISSLTIEVKEYRDEANRPWWKFFDEFEYRYTKEESARHEWWRWFEKDTPAKEKVLLWKLDLLVTFCAFLGYWVKSLDQANVTNAYVSGLKEDIGMKGNDLINTQVIFIVGAIIFDLPFLYILPRVSPTYLLFGAELGWSFFTFITAAVQNPASLKAFRFFVGAFEAAYFPIIHHSFANWYRPVESQRRAGFFYFGMFLGNLTSGLLQGQIYNTLNGVHGIAGWRWMFIIDGVISISVSFIALISLPGTPFKCYSIWLTDDEIKLARKRMRLTGLDEHGDKKNFFDKNTWKKVFTTWHFWVFTLANIGGFNSNSATVGSFALWLKSLKRYSIGKINQLTAIPAALGIAYIVVICFGADVIRKRFLMICFSQLMNIIGNSILAVWDVPEKVKWFAYFFGFWSWSQSSVFYPLHNDILRKDGNLKAIEWVLSYTLAQQSNAWVSKLLFPTVDAPRFHTGFTGSACFAALQVVAMAIGLWFYKRDERRDAHSNGIIVFNSNKGESPESALGKLRAAADDGSAGSNTALLVDPKRQHEVSVKSLDN